MYFAIISLPVPVSPTIITDALVGDALRASSVAALNAADVPNKTSPLIPLVIGSELVVGSLPRRVVTAWGGRPSRGCSWGAGDGFGQKIHAPNPHGSVLCSNPWVPGLRATSGAGERGIP